jgi:hypothetical protein
MDTRNIVFKVVERGNFIYLEYGGLSYLPESTSLCRQLEGLEEFDLRVDYREDPTDNYCVFIDLGWYDDGGKLPCPLTLSHDFRDFLTNCLKTVLEDEHERADAMMETRK